MLCDGDDGDAGGLETARLPSWDRPLASGASNSTPCIAETARSWTASTIACASLFVSARSTASTSASLDYAIACIVPTARMLRSSTATSESSIRMTWY